MRPLRRVCCGCWPFAASAPTGSPAGAGGAKDEEADGPRSRRRLVWNSLTALIVTPSQRLPRAVRDGDTVWSRLPTERLGVVNVARAGYWRNGVCGLPLGGGA